MPKPPPTSGVMTRKFAGSVLKTAPIRVLISQPPCVLAYSVQRPEAGSKSAIEARASIDATMTRLFTTVSRVTCAAVANSASVAALSPIPQSNTTLFATSGHTSGAPGPVAADDIHDGGLDGVIDRDQFRGVARRPSACRRR